MTRVRFAALVLLVLGSFACVSTPEEETPRSVPGGPANGAFDVNGDVTHLTQAYAMEFQPARRKPRELHILLTEQALPREIAEDFSRLPEASWIAAVEIVADDQGHFQRVRFFHDDLPAGIDVMGKPARLTLDGLATGALVGSFTFDDKDQYSWSVRATFQAQLVRQPAPEEPQIPANAYAADRARIELEADGIAFEERAFLDQCLAGEAERVRLFLAAGMPATTRSPRGSALSDALVSKSLPTVQALLDAGADANEKLDEYDTTVLHRAVDTGDAAIVRALLGAKANPNLANTYRVTPLMSAALTDNLAMVDALIKAGAKVTARTPTGGTALMFAVSRGQVEVSKRLIAAGADVARDKDSLLEIAKQQKKPALEAVLRDALRAAGKAKPKTK